MNSKFLLVKFLLGEIKIMKKSLIILLGLQFLASASFAGIPEQITNKEEINKILSQIPVTDKNMNYRNIGERLANIGMTVDNIMIYKITKKSDIESDEDRLGDVIFQVYTSNPSSILTTQYCDMLGSPTYLKRNGKYIPQDRTAVWLMTSKC
ncbi:hypothetical protein [Crenothrix sp.]|uniref:hypothetical protein n=1 Tax=Crenothrix sp. TaxID=3100433 RepID=UPI00374DA852